MAYPNPCGEIKTAAPWSPWAPGPPIQCIGENRPSQPLHQGNPQLVKWIDLRLRSPSKGSQPLHTSQPGSNSLPFRGAPACTPKLPELPKERTLNPCVSTKLVCTKSKTIHFAPRNRTMVETRTLAGICRGIESFQGFLWFLGWRKISSIYGIQSRR